MHNMNIKEFERIWEKKKKVEFKGFSFQMPRWCLFVFLGFFSPATIVAENDTEAIWAFLSKHQLCKTYLQHVRFLNLQYIKNF